MIDGSGGDKWVVVVDQRGNEGGEVEWCRK